MAKLLNPKCATAYEDITRHVEDAMNMPIPPDQVHDMVGAIIRNTAKQTASPADVAVGFTLNGMLSSLGTPLANIAGILGKMIQEPLNDTVQRGIIEGKPVQALRELSAGYSNMLNSFRLAIAMGKEGWTKGYPLDFNATLAILAKENSLSMKDLREMLVDEVIDYRAQLMSRSQNVPFQDARKALVDTGYMSKKDQADEELQVFLNEAYDYNRNVFTGRLAKFKWINVPTKGTVAIDEFGKALFRQYKIGRMASEKAAKDVAEMGGNYNDLVKRYITQVNEGIVDGDATATLRNLQKTTDDLFSDQDATPYTTIKEYAQRQMFQQRLTGFPAGVHKLLIDHPSIRAFVPFMKTPWNITKEGFSYLPAVPVLMKEGYPVAAKALNWLAKGQWEHNPSLKNLGPYYELNRRELIARNMVGTAYFAGIMGMIESDEITGKPRTAQEAQRWKDQGIPEQSIKVGDSWVSYSRLEPMATVFGLAQELRRAYQDFDNPKAGASDDEKMGSIMSGIAYALKANIMDKSFVDGFNQLINGLTSPEQRYQTLALAATKPFTPALLNQVARILDPHERVATTVGEKLQQRVPLLREDLPVEYGLYGEPRSGNMLQEWTSFNVSDANQTPVQRAFTESGADPVRNNAKLKGLGLNTEQIAEYRKQIAEFITPRLERFVEGEAFKRMPKSRQKIVLEKMVTRLKRPVTIRFANQLKRDPEMARRFREVELEKIGMFDQ